MGEKRPIDYTTVNWPGSDDFVMIDGSTNGTRKIKANNVMNANGISNVLELRTGDVLVRSSLVRAGNVVFMSAVIQLNSDVNPMDTLLHFITSGSDPIGNIKPGYAFDVMCSYGNALRSISYTNTAMHGDKYDIDPYSFYNPYGLLSITSGTYLRVSASWAVS